MQREDTSGLAKLIWDGENILTETDVGGTMQVQVTLECELYGNLISQRRSGASVFHAFDALGSTDRLIDSASVVTDSYCYQAFGFLQSSSGISLNPYRYVGMLGYYFDEMMSLILVRSRFLVPLLMRWASTDPISPLLDETNAFEYAGNSPTNFADPSGLFWPRRRCIRPRPICACRPLSYYCPCPSIIPPSGDTPQIVDPCEQMKDPNSTCYGLTAEPIPEKVSGLTFCNNGKLVYEIYPRNFPVGLASRDGDPCFRSCVEEHEKYHMKQVELFCPLFCKYHATGRWDIGYGGNQQLAEVWECPADWATVNCLQRMWKEIRNGNPRKCNQTAFRQYLAKYLEEVRIRCANFQNPPPNPPVYGK